MVYRKSKALNVMWYRLDWTFWYIGVVVPQSFCKCGIALRLPQAWDFARKDAKGWCIREILLRWWLTWLRVRRRFLL